MLLHTDAFTHRCFYTQKLWQLWRTAHRSFVHTEKIAHVPQFLAIDPNFVRKGCAGQLEIAILLQFLTIEPHFVWKGSRDTWNRNFTSVFDDRPSFRAKQLRGTTWTRTFTSVFDDRTSFRAKRVHGTTWTRTFTSVFDDRTSFRAKGLRGATWTRMFKVLQLIGGLWKWILGSLVM